MKLPDIVQQPVGEYALGNIPAPNAQAVGTAMMNLIGEASEAMASVQASETVAQIDEATGNTANELSELRSTLVNSNTVDADWVGDDALGQIQVSTTRNGERETDTAVKMFTHEIAEELWAKRSKEIVEYHAGTIKNSKASKAFIGEMTQRYVAPGTQAVGAANIIRRRSYGQAQAERAVDLVLSSDAPSEEREASAMEIIDRQVLMGADPTWGQNQHETLGPTIDQLDVHNEVMAAQTADHVDQIEETMYSSGNRMSPAQMRTMSAVMDQRRREFKSEDQERQDRNADSMFLDFHDPDVPVTEMDVAQAVDNQQISREAGWTFVNGLNRGSTTKASDQFTLSQYRGEIFRLQYTGGEGNLRVSDKAKLLKLMISRGSMGLTPQGTPTGQPATISGVDANILNKEIDAAVKLAVENEEYKNAFQNVLMWTRSKLDLEGQIVTAFGGDQNQVEAAVAFKNALDNYMDTYGADAKPTDFFESNKDAYDPRNFTSGINGSYLKAFPSVKPFMTQVSARELNFDAAQQENFLLWMADNAESIGPEKYAAMSAMFHQYYRGKGIAPDNGALMLEPDDPLYRQFQQMMPDYE